MSARIVRLDLNAGAPGQAAEVIQAGGLIIFPTDTVWGLGADATNSRAIERLHRLKGRSGWQPLALHLASVQALLAYCAELSAQQRCWIERLLPGPYTLVLPAAAGTPAAAVNSAGGVGLRVPACRDFQKLAGALSHPLVGSSVNRSGRPPLIQIEEIVAQFGDAVDLILTGDQPMSGESSSLIDLTGAVPHILRGKLPQGLLVKLSASPGPSELEVDAGAG